MQAAIEIERSHGSKLITKIPLSTAFRCQIIEAFGPLGNTYRPSAIINHGANKYGKINAIGIQIDINCNGCYRLRLRIDVTNTFCFCKLYEMKGQKVHI